ncbi:MAG: hypothetical protein Cons2KO_13670 [Congregibacter sp.]
MTETPVSQQGALDQPRPGLWLSVGALIYLSFSYTEMLGSDLWWHIAAGREIVQAGSLWLVDDWSFTALGQPWRNHEWLADLIFYGWVNAFGLASLVYWKWLTIIAAFVLLQLALTRVTRSPAAALAATVLACAIAAPFMDMRPQLYTLVGVAVLLCIALERRPRLLELLALFLVWANLHGGFVFGLMLLAVLSFPWRALHLGTLRNWAPRLGVCCAICLVNPDGLQVFLLPLTYALDSSSPYRGLGEWISPFVDGGIRSPLYPYTLVIAAGLAAFWVLPGVRRKVRFSPEALGFALLTAAMSATSRRFIILWAFAFALLVAPFIAAVLRGALAAIAPRWLAVCLLLVAAVFGVYRQHPYPLRANVAFHYLTAEYAYPHALADFLQLNKLQGKTFAYYNWGGFLHWRTDGAIKVFIDGRANTVFDDQTYRDYVAVLGFRPGWLERVENSGAQIVIWPHSRGGERMARGLQQTRRWRRLYEDVRGVVLARDTLALPPTLRLPRDTVESALAKGFVAARAGDLDAALVAAKTALAEQPWHQGACTAAKRALIRLDRKSEAAEVVKACRTWFPSRYLR